MKKGTSSTGEGAETGEDVSGIDAAAAALGLDNKLSNSSNCGY